jgi:hypothetical protein
MDDGGPQSPIRPGGGQRPNSRDIYHKTPEKSTGFASWRGVLHHHKPQSVPEIMGKKIDNLDPEVIWDFSLDAF